MFVNMDLFTHGEAGQTVYDLLGLFCVIGARTDQDKVFDLRNSTLYFES